MLSLLEHRVVRWALAMIAAPLAGLVLWGIGGTSRDAAIADVKTQGQKQLDLFISNLRSELERYEFLPRVLGNHPAVVRLLEAPNDAGQRDFVNRYLEEINRVVRASDTYIMDIRGDTVAASNWNSNRPFVGRNFSYRPYFQAAVQGETGRYYALGTTSRKRGYYYAHPVTRNGRILGVTVVKVSMDRIESAWAQAAGDVIVTDYNGVVFITSHPEWRFKLLRPLEDEVVEQIRASRQYAGADLSPLPIIREEVYDEGVRFVSMRRRPGPTNVNQPWRARYLLQTSQLPEYGWIVHTFTPTETVTRRTALAVMLTFFLGVTLVMVVVYLIQRRRLVQESLDHQRRVQETLRRGRDELEARVEERTADLMETNVRLDREIEAHKRAENELRRAQDELVQAAKLAALGQLSAGISHELNQPLAAISAYADNARAFLERGRLEEAGTNLSTITELTDRMAKITAHLKTFARKTSDEVSPVPLARVLSDALSLVASRIRMDQAQVEARLPEDTLLVRGDPIRLEQVFVNLFKNALDAMREREVRTLHVDVEPEEDAVTIRVRDTGTGIADADLPQLFDPFFTTKEVGEGLGLGLSISFSIVRNFGGTMHAANHPEGGAEFEVVLPRSHATEENAA